MARSSWATAWLRSARGAQFARLRGDVRGLALEHEEHRAQAGVEPAPLALVLLERVPALR